MQKIGEGAYSEVFRFGEMVVKIPHDNKIFYNELAALTQVRHPNIISLIGVHYTIDVKICPVMPYIQSMPLDKLTPGQLREVVGDILDALTFLHQHALIHGDAKLGNVLIDASGTRPRGILADLGSVSRIGELILPQMDPDFQPPESLAKDLLRENQKAEASLDIWTLGASILRELTGQKFGYDEYMSSLSCSYANMTYEQLVESQWKGTEGYLDELKKTLPFLFYPNGFEFLSEMLQLAPENRATARDLLRSHFRNETSGEFLKPEPGPYLRSMVPKSPEDFGLKKIWSNPLLPMTCLTWSKEDLADKERDLLTYVCYYITQEAQNTSEKVDAEFPGVSSSLFQEYCHLAWETLGGRLL